MGDRAQIAVKQRSGTIYLYGHWLDAGCYSALQDVLKRGQRLDDEEYFTRILAREMGMGEDGETGFGIGLAAHGDIEHMIPVVDIGAQRVLFQDAEWEHNKNGAASKSYSFAEFAALTPATFEDW